MCILRVTHHCLPLHTTQITVRCFEVQISRLAQAVVCVNWNGLQEHGFCSVSQLDAQVHPLDRTLAQIHTQRQKSLMKAGSSLNSNGGWAFITRFRFVEEAYLPLVCESERESRLFQD